MLNLEKAQLVVYCCWWALVVVVLLFPPPKASMNIHVILRTCVYKDHVMSLTSPGVNAIMNRWANDDSTANALPY